MSIIDADWPAPDHVVAGVTTRCGGFSCGNFTSNNLALHVGDDVEAVLKNRQQLAKQLAKKSGMNSNWQWLNQIHGESVFQASNKRCENVPDADAVFTDIPQVACAVMTADCLPILLTNTQGSKVAAIHAGWRSLCGGVIENTVAAMSVDTPSQNLMAWLGPAIGAQQFEVGQDVVDAFLAQLAAKESQKAFSLQNNGKYLADIYQLATIRLKALGIDAIYGGDDCTVSDETRFYSYRRDGQTGRMASFIVMV